MAFFNEFPNTRTYDNDLGWLIHVVGQLQNEVQTFIENNTINIPDQITWDITKQYTRNTLVIDYDGTAYLSKQPVPVGIAITNTDYWMPIFNYDDSINTLRANIATNERNHTTASAERHAGDLVWLGNALYKVTADMPAGTAYIAGTNVELYTVEDYLLFLKDAIAAEAQAREDADTTLQGHIDAVQGNLDAEALARQGADNTLQGNIDAEVLARQGADNTLQGNIDAITAQIPELKNSYYDMAAHGADKTGAVACDSILEDAIASGDVIFFPEGTYLFSAQHTFANNIVLGYGCTFHTTSFGLGSGELNQYGGFNSTYRQMLFRCHANTIIKGIFFDLDAGGLIIEGDNVTIEDCKFTTFATASQIIGQTGYYAIAIRGCSNIHLNKINVAMVEGNNRDGIHIEGNTHNVYINDCQLTAGDDGLALNALEGLGGAIYNIYVNNTYIGGYGLRFFGCTETPIYHVVVNNCTLEINANDMQSGCVRFSNSAATIGGQATYSDGYFNNIFFSDCIFIANAETNLSVYTYNARVSAKFINCAFYGVIYGDANASAVSLAFCNCVAANDINLPAGSSYDLTIVNSDLQGVKKAGAHTANVKITNCNIGGYLVFTGGASAVYVSDSLLVSSPTLSASGSYKIHHCNVPAAFEIVAGAADYIIDHLIGKDSTPVITSAGNATRINTDCVIDAQPAGAVEGDRYINSNTIYVYLGGAWKSVTVA